MTLYKINEIFYSLQGEGYYSGIASIFIRFSGCNLSCSFCDTQHETGELMTQEQILDQVTRFPAKHVVLTGGEPSLFVTKELVESLHAAGKYVCIETNGLHALPEGIDWVTLSPKTAQTILKTCNELKVVFTDDTFNPHDEIKAAHYFIQPCDMGNSIKNNRILASCISYVKENPHWRLSLQTHKMIGIH